MEALDWNWSVYWEQALEYAPKLVMALVILVVGWVVVNFLVRALHQLFQNKDYDPSLETFLESLARVLLRAGLLITVITVAGVDATAFVALLGGAGLAVGLALSGTLQNFAGGVMILIFRPFAVGDVIEAQGYSGVVKQIQIFNTVLNTADRKTVIIPNSPLSTGSLINYSTEPIRRVDFVFGIGYDDDIDQARSILRALIDQEERVHPEPEPVIVVSELADSSVNLSVRVFVDSGNYWPVYFDLTEKVKKEFDSKQISFPYPQRDVHMVAAGA